MKTVIQPPQDPVKLVYSGGPFESDPNVWCYDVTLTFSKPTTLSWVAATPEPGTAFMCPYGYLYWQGGYVSPWTYVGPPPEVPNQQLYSTTHTLRFYTASTWFDRVRIANITAYGTEGCPAKILSPQSGDVFAIGEKIDFLGWPTLPFSWESSLDGLLYSTNVFTTPVWSTQNLSPGQHVITLKTHYIDQEFSDSVTITVGQTASLSISLPANSDVFGYGETVTLSASQTGTVTNIEWLDNGTLFASGLSASKNDLSAGVHTITIRGMSAGSQISDSVSIAVVKSIKMKDMDTGQPPVEPFKMSSILGIKKFQAIGCFDDAGNNEFGAVKVKWSLPDPDGKLDPTHITKGEILDFLGSNRGKIGVLVTQNSTATELLDSDTATFVSFFSGNITLKTEFRVGKIHSVIPKTLSIGLKQPKLFIKINRIDSISDSFLVQKWKSVVEDTWKKEGIFAIEFINSLPDPVTNVVLSDPTYLPDSYEDALVFLGKAAPDLEFAIANDTKQNAIYGGRTVFTRQLETLLSKKRGGQKIITITITKGLIDTAIPITPITPGFPLGGWTSSSPHTYKRDSSPVKIDDPSEAGISLTNVPYADNNFSPTDPPTMAHEIGHILIKGANDHYRADGSNWGTNNLMIQGATGITLEPIQWVQALGLNGSPSFFVMEE